MRFVGSFLALPLATLLAGCIIVTDGSSASDSASGTTAVGTDSNGGTTDAGSTSEGTGSASGSTTGPTTGATTGGASAQAANVSESCAPDDGPAADFTIGLLERTCGAGLPADAPTLRITLFQSLPLGAGEYNLDGGFGSVYYEDANGVVSGNTGKLTITEVTADGYVGTYDVTLMNSTQLAGDFDAIYCPTDVLCG